MGVLKRCSSVCDTLSPKLFSLSINSPVVSAGFNELKLCSHDTIIYRGWDSGISVKFEKVSCEAKQNLRMIDNVV